MNIAFVANGHKCQFFDLIGKTIKEKMSGINIYWICISLHQYKYLLSNGYNENEILMINWDVRKLKDRDSIGEYKIHELIWGDRRMKYHFNEAFKCLTNIQSLFYDFVVKNNLKFIFGEMTWAHEILMNRICQDKFSGNCVYLHPQSIRIPNGRFVFMNNEFQNSLFPASEYFHPEEYLNEQEVPIKPIVPQRVAEVAADVQSRLSWKYKMKRILGFLIFNRLRSNNSDSLQSIQYPFFVRIGKFWQEEFNKFYYTKLLKKNSIEDLKDKKFFFITLHMQPEASIDVVGRYHEDQYEMIRDVWRILPNDYYIVIKEHTNAIGNRGKAFFLKCLSLKNVLIVNEWESSHQLLNMAEAVFTNSGTVALERALYDKVVFLFSRIFFDKLAKCHCITLEDLKFSANYYKLLESCEKRDIEKMSKDDYSKYILRSSFSGVIDPHDNSHYYTDRSNIEMIANSFKCFLQEAKMNL